MQLLKTEYWKAHTVRIAMGGLLILIVAQQLVSIPSDSQLTEVLNNAAHTPWFMSATLLLWLLLRRMLSLSFWQKIALCALVAITLSIMLEAMQVLTSRQASWSDAGRNFLGALSCLSLILAAHFRKRSRIAVLLLLLTAAGCIYLGVFKELRELFWLQQERDARAPLLIDFTDSENITLNNFRADWTLEAERFPWPEFEQQSIARVTLNRRWRWPGIRIEEPYPDWATYNTLEIHTYLDSESDLPLTVRVQTFQRRGLDSTVDIVLSPGANHIKIPISKLLPDPVAVTQKVKTLYIFGDRELAGNSFLLGSIFLAQ